VRVIVNPVAGPHPLDLAALNNVLSDISPDWDILVTRQAGDAQERAQQAVAAQADAIAVYGGDGTVMEVAGALAGTDIPLAILPGGTANVLATELGIPRDVSRALQLVTSAEATIRPLDMAAIVDAGGQCDAGWKRLCFRLGIGLEGRVHDAVDRGAKDRAGLLAYIAATVDTWAHAAPARYALDIDGERIETDGVNCLITNYGSLGFGGLTLSHSIEVDDGLLDVILFQDAGLSSLLAVAASAAATGELARPLLHWQAQEVRVDASPPQPVAIDGDVLTTTPVTVRVAPQAVRVLAPHPR
jgi:YegS/Rv2252/BmrU family lipid kinase